MHAVFDYQLYSDIVETSFTKRKNLTGGEQLLMKLSYKYHQLRVCFLTLKAFVFLRIFYPEIVRVQYENRRQGGLSGKYQWLRLAEIAALVKKFQPGSVCEFGAGTSSALFARLIGAGFATYEESPYWRERLLGATQGLAANLISYWQTGWWSKKTARRSHITILLTINIMTLFTSTAPNRRRLKGQRIWSSKIRGTGCRTLMWNYFGRIIFFPRSLLSTGGGRPSGG